MKKVFAILLLIYSQFSFADICASENNVKEYFLSIPSENLRIIDDSKGPINTPEELESTIETLDIKNGFISLKNQTVLSKTEIVLYRASNKRPLILVTSDGASIQNIYAFSCYNQQWHNVKDIIFPNQSFDAISEFYNSNNVLIKGGKVNAKDLSMVVHTLLRYKLPRKGKSIKAYASHPDLDYPEQHVLFEFEPALEKLVWKK
jgi:hypothetical protein